jgi:hypothetical protein
VEAPVRRSYLVATAATVAFVVAGFPVSAPAQTGVTAFEGARLIVGDGRAPLENATLVVDGTRIVQAGSAADVTVPAGATRVSLAGQTVMPTIIDTHVHTSPTRELLTRDLKRRAYFGVGAVMSLGQDPYALLDMRKETIPGAARFFSAGRGITMPEPGRLAAPHWIETETEGRKVVQELAAQKVDIVKIWVDDRDGHYKKLTPPKSTAPSSTRRTSTGCGSPRISSISTTPRGSFVPAWMRSRTAFATRTSTTNWWPCSSSTPV